MEYLKAVIQLFNGERMDYFAIKNRVYRSTMNLYQADLIRLSAGNVSARIDYQLAAITPSGRQYDILKPEDICIISLDGKLVAGEFKPSSETPLPLLGTRLY